ncbi:hypothetical protein [Streptococcus caprae]|uniref:Uncharacterized protein n=1 Tax=Streptococcus caprae TaxID=1640501 RepID=A0ABV8CUE1_9STRE
MFTPKYRRKVIYNQYRSSLGARQTHETAISELWYSLK